MPTEYVDEAVDRIVAQVLALGEREIPSRQIGEMVMQELYKLDKVAYIRFASVYRAFQDVDGLPRRAEGSRDAGEAVAEVRAPAPDASAQDRHRRERQDAQREGIAVNDRADTDRASWRARSRWPRAGSTRRRPTRASAA